MPMHESEETAGPCCYRDVVHTGSHSVVQAQLPAEAAATGPFWKASPLRLRPLLSAFAIYQRRAGLVYETLKLKVMWGSDSSDPSALEVGRLFFLCTSPPILKCHM